MWKSPPSIVETEDGELPALPDPSVEDVNPEGLDETEPPAEAAFPVRPGTEARRLYQAQPAKHNRPPIPALTIRRLGDDTQPASGALRVWAGDTVELDAQATHDPDGDAILRTLITTPDGHETRAGVVQWTFARVGRFKIAIEAMDAHGARARKKLAVVALPHRSPR